MAGPIQLERVEHQQRVSRIGLGAEAIVGQHHEAVIAERTDAGKALQGLALKRHADAGLGILVFFQRLDAGARREAARDLEIGRGIGRGFEKDGAGSSA